MSSLSLVRGFYGVNLSLPSVGSEQLVITATERDARTQSATLVIDGALAITKGRAALRRCAPQLVFKRRVIGRFYHGRRTPCKIDAGNSRST